MNGQTHIGLVSRFSPTVADITLALSRQGKAKTRFAAEQLAYGGFDGAPGEPPPRPNARKA
jgi:hypothetical protein